MKTTAEIEEAIRLLPHAEKEELLSRLEDMIEDELEFTDEFKARIAQAKVDQVAG